MTEDDRGLPPGAAIDRHFCCNLPTEKLDLKGARGAFAQADFPEEQPWWHGRMLQVVTGALRLRAITTSEGFSIYSGESLAQLMVPLKHR